MKKTGLLLVMICSIIISSTACVNANFGKAIKGNGIKKEQDRGKMEFTAIDTRGSIDVIISNLTDAPVIVSGDENLIEYVETYVKNGVLNVHLKDKAFSSYSSRIGLKVTVPNNGKINSIKASGSSDVITEGIINADYISIKCSGSSDFKGSVKAEKCEIDCGGSSDFKGSVEATTCIVKCTGSSDCIISGKADVCEISMTGSSDFKGYDFTVNKLTCSSTGSSDIKITCNEELSARASGSSDISYRGSAKVVSMHTSGSSDIKNK